LLSISVATFLILVVVTRRIALGSIAAAVALPVVLFLMRTLWHVPVASSWLGTTLMLALLIAHTHRQNIARLIAGNEASI
jgi:glycerol-3-phosphate acyltransferase PlsY